MLTDARIRAMKAKPGERIEAGDALVPGLRIRVSGRSKTWVLRQRIGGKVRTVTLGHFGEGNGAIGLAAARTAAVAMQGRVAEGVIPTPASPRARVAGEGLTVASLFESYLTSRIDKGLKHPDAYRWQFGKYLAPRIGEWAVAAVSKADARQMLLDIREQHGLTTARRVGGLLKRLFAFAAQEDAIAANPLASLALPGREVQRDRTLSDAELAALWKVTDPINRPAAKNGAGRPRSHPSMHPWGAYFRLLVLTGQRRGEVAAMRWDALDLDAGTWTLTAGETKSARAHVVALSSAAVALLRSLPRFGTEASDGGPGLSPWVLTTNGKVPIAIYSKPKGWLDAAMIDALRSRDPKAELPHWTVHDLRRTVSTNLARMGCDPHIRRRVLNHALDGVDAIYDRFDYVEPKREVMEAWAAMLERIASGKPVHPRFLDAWRRELAMASADNVAALPNAGRVAA